MFPLNQVACGTRLFYRYGVLPHYLLLVSRTRFPKIIITPSKVRHVAASNTYLESIGKKGTDFTETCKNKPQQIPNVWTVPNLLCGVRILAAPFLSNFILDHAYSSAIGVLIAAGLTDLADGYIARNYKGQSSKLGTFLDPLADKILIITLYSSMAFTGLIPALLMKIIVFRDVILLSVGMYIRYISLQQPRTLRKYFDGSSSQATLQPTYLSKINTVLQIVIAAISLCAPTTSWITENTLFILWNTAGFSTIISGLSYVFSKNTFIISKNGTKGSR